MKRKIAVLALSLCMIVTIQILSENKEPSKETVLLSIRQNYADPGY
ncbi:hypothetical protein [Brevibacillus halotolerans]|nr:hypothetical protein [Brevibacillus halotolerans]MBA4535515.1 hypothetical protein [Brevibacillus halotolerans]